MFSIIEIALSIGVLATFVTVLSACVCGCKNSNQKSELVGTAGVVKIRFDEEVPSPTPTTPASIKRASTQNSQRSLPEIPHPVGRHDSGDTASEIYATVNIDDGNKNVPTTSSNRDHPYEHAYAKLQNQNDSHNVTVEITPDEASENTIQIDEREATQSGPESVVISASVAISGQLPSSQELPYITPPSPRPNVETAAHFSGDSTDSAKGYTSISVREPLSNIRAQSNKPTQPHYATVSDDSDEMYAAIEEASVGEGSDTYAQIAPEPRRRDVAAAALPDLLHNDVHHARRSAPPEIGAASLNATHSRQASSSSCSNSTGALGSPKPEKRSANSPLPPPPAASAGHPHPHPHSTAQRATLDQRHQRIYSTGDLFNHDKFRRSLNEKHQRNNSCVSSSDFYGCNYPVEKHRFSSGELIRPLVAKEMHVNVDASDTVEPCSLPERSRPESPERNLDEMYAKVIKKGKLPAPAEDPGYESIDRRQSGSGSGYESVARSLRKVSGNDPGYETVRDLNRAPDNFANNNSLNHVNSGPNSIVSSDAGYEHIAKGDPASDSEPNYEVLRNQPPTPPYATIAGAQPTYSTVNKRSAWPTNNNEPLSEPNYESMPHDPLYTTGSESDPNYESVRPKDPNYESVNPQDPNYESLRCKDPKYESVRSKHPKYDSVRSKREPNYESVKYFELSKKDPPYERLNNAANSSVDRSDSSAGYERINVAGSREPKSSINNGADGTVSDYFQV